MNLDNRFLQLWRLNILDMSGMARNTVRFINFDVTRGSELMLKVNIDNPACANVSHHFGSSFRNRSAPV